MNKFLTKHFPEVRINIFADWTNCFCYITMHAHLISYVMTFVGEKHVVHKHVSLKLSRAKIASNWCFQLVLEMSRWFTQSIFSQRKSEFCLFHISNFYCTQNTYTRKCFYWMIWQRELCNSILVRAFCNSLDSFFLKSFFQNWMTRLHKKCYLYLVELL